MAKYYVDGYTTPDGVNSADSVRKWQKKLGVKADGIWGEKTQSAYEKYMSGAEGSSTVQSGGFDWAAAGERIKKQLEEILRPAVDAAINRRRKSAKTERAEIDADAAARGMESSTYVTDVKSDVQNSVQEDIADYETEYSRTLAQTLQTMLTDAYKSYAQEQAQAAQLALEREKLAQDQDQFEKTLALEKRKLSAKSSGNASDSVQSAPESNPGRGFTVDDYRNYVWGLSYDDRRKLFNSDELYWKFMREQIIADIGSDEYAKLASGARKPADAYPVPHEKELPEYGITYGIV